MEILDTLTQHDTDEPVDLPGEDRYGWSYVPKEIMDTVMERLALKAVRKYGRSSVVWFRGELGTLHVEVSTTRVARVLLPSGGLGWMYVQDSYSGIPHSHYRMKAYMPENVHIRGKGRDKYAWSIYRGIVHLINWEGVKYG